FAFRPCTEEITVKHILAEAENAIELKPEPKRNINRAKVTNIVTNYINKHDQDRGAFVADAFFLEARRFLSAHPELVVSNSNKGNVSVVLTKTQYKDKLMELLSDKRTYEYSPSNPTDKIMRGNNEKSKEFHKNKYITQEEKNIVTHTQRSHQNFTFW
ncbi:hypothetical protein HHI36_007588, partial [Cryptolaemus montrouzieri]